MRARGSAGRHERRETGREDEDLVAIDYCNLKLLMVQKMTMTTTTMKQRKTNCSSGCGRCEDRNVCCNLSSRKGSELLCYVVVGVHSILQSYGGPSIVALKTATLLSSAFVKSVLRESPIGEHATNDVAESAMREVKRQTRTLIFALDAHVGNIVESHSILEWIPTMAADAISFFRIEKDGLTAEMRRSGRAWKKLVAEFVESVHYRPAVARAVASRMQNKLYVGRYRGHHARTGSIPIMTTDGVVKAARISKGERRESMECRKLECSSRSSLGCNRN